MKKLTISIILLLLILPITLAYQIDPSELTYVEKEADYSRVNSGRIDRNGYTQGNSFKWKVDHSKDLADVFP